MSAEKGQVVFSELQSSNASLPCSTAPTPTVLSGDAQQAPLTPLVIRDYVNVVLFFPSALHKVTLSHRPGNLTGSEI